MSQTGPQMVAELPTSDDGAHAPLPGEGDARTAAQESSERLTPETVQRLFEEHNRALIRFLRTRVRSDHEARDVAQEAYVRLLQLDHVQTVSFLRAYLFRIALNIATDRIRAEAFRHHAHQDPVFDHDDVEPDPERKSLAREQLRLLDQCLEELPSKARLAFLWHRVSEMKVDEIAARLGVSDRMVRKYQVQAVLHLRSRMDAIGVDCKGLRE
jgi:RNA polymerase sigma factor (sigma-70 family)